MPPHSPFVAPFFEQPQLDFSGCADSVAGAAGATGSGVLAQAANEIAHSALKAICFIVLSRVKKQTSISIRQP